MYFTMPTTVHSRNSRSRVCMVLAVHGRLVYIILDLRAALALRQAYFCRLRLLLFMVGCFDWRPISVDDVNRSSILLHRRYVHKTTLQSVRADVCALRQHFYRATICVRVVFALTRCLFVRLSRLCRHILYPNG